MNPIVFAMRRPITVMVLVVAVALGSVLAVTRMPIDIFPNLNLPVVYVCQPYGGMDPAQMEGLLTNYYEYHFLYITGIHHVESRNIQGMALMKLFFHPGTNMAQAMAETIGYVTRSRAFMPPGTVSPFITRFDAGSVPVGYLVLSSETKSIGEIQDQALFKVRPMFASLPGVSAPPPFGGNQRTVVVRVDPDRLRAYSMSPDEVIAALDERQHDQPLGQRPHRQDDADRADQLAGPTRSRSWRRSRSAPGRDPTVYIRDVATVQDASDIPAGYALVNGRRAVYILVTKRADASTLSVVSNVKEALPKHAGGPARRHQGQFRVRPVAHGHQRRAEPGHRGRLGCRPDRADGARSSSATGGASSSSSSTSRSPSAARWWRCGSPGQTINLMTLGGLALAIGILVDESTVEIENIHHKMEGTRSVARRSGRATRRRRSPGCWRCSACWRCSSRRSSCRGRRRRCSSRCRWPSGSRWSRRTCSRAPSCRCSRPGCCAPSPPPGRGQQAGAPCSSEDATPTAGPSARVVRWRWVVVPAYLAWHVAVIVGVGAVARPGDLPQGRRRAVPAPDAGADRHAVSRRPRSWRSPPWRRSRRRGRRATRWRSRSATSG